MAVCNPAARTYRRENDSVETTEGAAERIYRTKIDLYREFATHSSSIVPFVIESTGRMHAKTREFIQLKFQQYLKDPIRDLHARCAVIIQRYNAKMAAANLRAKTVRTR